MPLVRSAALLRAPRPRRLHHRNDAHHAARSVDAETYVQNNIKQQEPAVKRARVNATGRNVTFITYLALPHHVLRSPGYLGLAPPARAVLIEIGGRFNGSNNGRIGISVRELAERCNISKDTAARGIQDLEDVGLIETVTKGAFRTSNRKASEYRLCWKKCDVTGTLPTSEYMRS
jgi:hypothetical protein